MPGSYTDQTIWNNSEIKAYLETLRSNEYITATEGNYYILGMKKII